MSTQPPAANGTTGGSMRIGPFWKRSADVAPPGGDEPFDALTDLFLGEVGGRSGKAPANGMTPARAAQPPADGPTLRLAGTGDDEYQLEPRTPVVSASEPIPTMAAAPVLMLEAEDDACEALPIAGVLPPPVRNPVLELLVLSNLPVLAGAWASQYVREIAEAAGKPVAYLRVQGEFVALEIVGALADVAGAPRPEDLGSLEAAIDAAAELTDRWIVRCDPGNESPVIGSSIARAVTVLTGTDQMALAACEKTLVALAPQLPGADDGPMVRLAMMGSDTEKTGAAGPVFATLAGAVLARPVATIACAGRIGGVRPAHPLFGGATELTLATLIKSVERALVAEHIEDSLFVARASTPRAAAAAMPIETVREEIERSVELRAVARASVTAEELASLANVDAVPGMTMADLPLPEPKPTIAEIAAGFAEPEPIEAVAQPHTPSPIPASPSPIAAPASTAAFPSLPPPLPRSVAPASVAPSRGSLAAHLPDLRTTALKCPYADGIEIAIDGTGALHLLARSHSEATDDAALAGLLVASTWTETHGALLGPAVGALNGERPTLHLFTDRPKATRRLLETNLRVHLLAEVNVGDERGWYFADLN